jgi:hypothetical protein
MSVFFVCIGGPWILRRNMLMNTFLKYKLSGLILAIANFTIFRDEVSLRWRCEFGRQYFYRSGFKTFNRV